MHSEGPDREREQRDAPLAVDGERDREGRGDRRPGDDPGRIGAGAERGPHGDPAGHDHRRDRAGDPDADADAERARAGSRARWARRCARPRTRRSARCTPRTPAAARAATPSRGPNGANSPMHSTGMVVRSPAAAAERPRSPRISGSSGPIERTCWRSASDAMNRPTTTATGTRGAGDDTPPMLSDDGAATRGGLLARSRHVVKGRLIVRRLGPKWRAAACDALASVVFGYLSMVRRRRRSTCDEHSSF